MRNALLAALLVCAILPGSAHPEEFFGVGNENFLLRGVYLPRAIATRAADAADFSASLTLANTINGERRGREQLFVDGESATVRLAFDAPVATSWRYRLSVPIIRDSGGFLDSTIDAWHRFFGLPRGDRPNYPKNRLRFFYTGDGHVDVRDSHTGLGDLAGEVGWFAVDTPARSIAIWTGVEAPTGSAQRLTGNGAWDAALWIHAAQRHSRWRFGAELGAVQTFGDEIFGGNAHRNSLFARMAATWDATHALALRLQFDAQSAKLEHTELRFLGPSLLLSAGISLAPGPRWRVELGFSEDAGVNTAPDVAFFLSVHRHAAH